MPANAQWVGPPAPAPSSTVWYRYTLNLDASVVDISTFSLPIGINVDDQLFHIYVNDEDILALPPISLPPGSPATGAEHTSTSPYSVTLDRGWKDGENQIIVVTYNYATYSALLVQPQPGGTAAPLCTKKASVAAVPTFDRRAYWLTALGILALGATAVARRRQGAKNL